MTTACQIAFYQTDEAPIEKWDALIYKHKDGFPEKILPKLTSFLTDYNQKRGLSDTENAAAWYTYELCREQKIFNLSNGIDTRYRDCGISKQFRFSIEYLYKVYPTKLQIMKVNNFSDGKYPLGEVIQEIAL